MTAATLGIAACLCFGSVSARAGGLFIPGAGPQGQSRAGAFVAKADDPTALFHNPAGLTKGAGTVLQLGVNLVDLSLEFERFGTYANPDGKTLSYAGRPYSPVSDRTTPRVGVGGFQAIPTIVIATDFGLNKRGVPVRFGFGFVAPQAFPERNFDSGYQFEADANEPPPPQRYDVITQQAATVMPSLGIAYRATAELDVGARLSAGFARLRGKSHVWGIANYEEWVARDGTFELDVRDNFVYAYGFGLLYRPVANIEIGASYTSATLVEARGRAAGGLGSDLGLGPGEPDAILPENETPACEAGGTDGNNLKACVSFHVPRVASLGLRYVFRSLRGAERGDIELDVKWEDWSGASTVRAIVDGKSMTLGRNIEPAAVRHGLVDVLSIRLGGSYTLPWINNAVSLRGGVAYDTKAAPASWNRLDLDSKPRLTLATGLAYAFGRFRIEVGGGIVLERDRVVPDTCDPTIRTQGCLGTGEETRVAERTRPDPVQPLAGPLNQIESPFNAGRYRSGYVLLHAGVTAKF